MDAYRSSLNTLIFSARSLAEIESWKGDVRGLRRKMRVNENSCQGL